MLSAVARSFTRLESAKVLRSFSSENIRRFSTVAAIGNGKFTKGCSAGFMSQCATVLGSQWGDEGKGKLVDILAKEYDIIARFNGGANAGHSLVVGTKKFAFHLLPCGMLYEDKINIIGNGVVLDIPTMLHELDSLKSANISTRGRLLISNRAHLVFDFHKMVDGQLETKAKSDAIGTTRRGIGPTYSSKMKRDGIRVGELVGDWETFIRRHTSLVRAMQDMYGFDYDILAEQAKYKQYAEIIRPMVVDTTHYLHDAYTKGKTILAEGANACLLDIDFGTYPYVTSSSTTVGGISTGLGISPNKIGDVHGVVKAYTTRVGSGPFPTELGEEQGPGEVMCRLGHEFGTTTGRPRRCGWLDIPLLKYSTIINGYTQLNLTKLDVLSTLSEIKIATHYCIDGNRLPDGYMPATIEELAKVTVEYESMQGWQCDISKASSFEELPVQAQKYVEKIEQLVGVPITFVGVGPARDEMITKSMN